MESGLRRFTEEEEQSIRAITKEVISQETHLVGQSAVTGIEEDTVLSARLASVVLNTAKNSPDHASLLIDMLEEKFPHSVLSGPMIERGMKEGFVSIDPFIKGRLKTSSYDISPGEYYWSTSGDHPGSKMFNPYNPDHVEKLWKGPYRAMTVRQQLSEGQYKDHLFEEDFKGLKPDDPVIILKPGETILSHTNEFIGGIDKVTSMMKARSSMGRIFLSVCKDAGWGDVGYFNRWTMEIQNNLGDAWSLVAVNQPIAQMVFFRVNPLTDKYSEDGHYQASADLQVLKDTWNPRNMLPNIKRI